MTNANTLDRLMARSVRTLGLGLSFVYLAMSVGHAFVLGGNALQVMLAVSGTSRGPAF